MLVLRPSPAETAVGLRPVGCKAADGTLVTFLSKISCCASAPLSRIVQPRGRGQPLKNMRVRGPLPLCRKEPPTEPWELPLLLSTRSGVEGGVLDWLLAYSDCVDLLEVFPNLFMPCRKARVSATISD